MRRLPTTIIDTDACVISIDCDASCKPSTVLCTFSSIFLYLRVPRYLDCPLEGAQGARVHDAAAPRDVLDRVLRGDS